MNYTESTRLRPEDEAGEKSHTITFLEKALLVLLIIMVAIGIGLTIIITSKTKADGRNKIVKSEEGICYSPACVTEAATLLKSMDMEVDPCTDFYTFVCGKWLNNTHLTASVESRFTELSIDNLLKVKDILLDLQKEKNLTEHSAKVSNFYESCADIVERNENGAKILKRDLEAFGGWPLIEDDWNPKTFKWEDLLINFFKTGYISKLLFTILVETDPMNTTRTLLAVRYPSLGLEHKEFYSPVYDMDSIYKEVIFKLAKMLREDIKEKKSMEAIDKAFKIEQKLAALIQGYERDPRLRYHIITIEELENKAPKIPWEKILRNMLPPDTELSKSERVSVSSLSMIEGLNKIFEDLEDEDGKEALANYMFYRMVLFAAHHLDTKFHTLAKIVRTKRGIPPMPPWRECLLTTLEVFHIPLTSLYVSKYLDAGTKTLIETFFKDLKYAVADDIRNSKWLDEETKSQALFKVSNIKAVIGYKKEIMNDTELDDFYREMNISDNHFENVKEAVLFQHHQSMAGLNEEHTRLSWPEILNLIRANAYYKPQENAIIIPAGILQDPFFYPGRPNYINYGGLGMIVGHEMTHAFDDIGRFYDEKGNYKMWWSDGSWKKYREKTKCFQDQYNKYYVPEAEEYVNGTLTIGENIADNGGLKATYHAYNKMLERMKTEKSLPGLPYNEKQMFWISYASVWCKKQTESNLRFSMKHYFHTPSQFRVIGSASNMKEFSDDFNCKYNSTMNPESKCSLWK